MKTGLLKAALLGGAFFFTSYLTLSAQSTRDSASVWSIYYSAGWKSSNLEKLNRRLAQNSYPSFQEGMVTLGVGFQENREGTVGMLEFLSSRMQNVSSAGKTFSYMDFLINLNFGYEVLKTGSFTMYPTAGLGYGGQYLSITTERDFNEILQNPVEQNVTLWNHNLSINAALNADYRTAADETPHGKQRFWLVGLRGGYTFAPLHWWRQNNAMLDVENSPKSNVTGPFVQVRLGLSTKAKDE
ncbi:MAG TPA: hypothetical protein VEC36_06095 [Patescibacteria group bacterium]|nr:hypothetical protein [Patescibacteria group bacterium]